MAKSMRSKREKRLRAIRREMVEPIYDKKDAAKLAAQQAALAAPKLPVRPSPFTNISTMDVAPASTSTAADAAMGTPFLLFITCTRFVLLFFFNYLGYGFNFSGFSSHCMEILSFSSTQFFHSHCMDIKTISIH